MRNVFDLPDLRIDGRQHRQRHRRYPPHVPIRSALFTAPRVDIRCSGLKHYTATTADGFQNCALHQLPVLYRRVHPPRPGADARDGGSYDAFVEPGDRITHPGDPAAAIWPARLPQMPTYHLTRRDHSGITMVNIGIGPSNAKTITDHIAVLRPHAWVMLGHCAGLQEHAETRRLRSRAWIRPEDHVLDADLPAWVPVPALAEIQVALERAVGEITGAVGLCAESVMRTGTVATINDHRWDCATTTSRCSASARTAPLRLTWKRHHRRQQVSLPGSLWDPCSVFPTSRCTAAGNFQHGRRLG